MRILSIYRENVESILSIAECISLIGGVMDLYFLEVQERTRDFRPAFSLRMSSFNTNSELNMQNGVQYFSEDREISSMVGQKRGSVLNVVL